MVGQLASLGIHAHARPIGDVGQQDSIGDVAFDCKAGAVRDGRQDNDIGGQGTD